MFLGCIRLRPVGDGTNACAGEMHGRARKSANDFGFVGRLRRCLVEAAVVVMVTMTDSDIMSKGGVAH